MCFIWAICILPFLLFISDDSIPLLLFGRGKHIENEYPKEIDAGSRVEDQLPVVQIVVVVDDEASDERGQESHGTSCQ